MMNKLVGLAILLIGMMLAVGVGATFRYYEAERTITVEIVPDDDEFIDLTPVQQYASLDGGKLVIRVGRMGGWVNDKYIPWAGMSPNTTYVFEEMFNVSNELWENEDGDFPICVQISITQGSGVEIFEGEWDGTSTTQLQFTVSHGTPVSVGMVFDTSGMALSQNPGDKQATMSITASAGACS